MPQGLLEGQRWLFQGQWIVFDPFHDLNAMYEAEKYFVQSDGCVWGEDWDAYCKELARVCAKATPPNCLARATAAQRAESFLRVLDRRLRTP